MNEKLSHILWIEAQEVAKKVKHKAVEPIDILLAILLDRHSQGSILLSQFFSQGINGVLKMGESLLREETPLEEKNKNSSLLPREGGKVNKSVKNSNLLGELKTKDSKYLNFSKKTKLLLEKAYKDLLKNNQTYLGTEHILVCLIEDKIIYEKLSKRIFLNDWKDKLLESFPKKLVKEIEPLRSTVSQFITNVTLQAKENKLDPLYGREKELKTLVSYLGRKKKNNVLLLGEPGIGKTALIEGLAQTFLESFDPSFDNLSKTILSLDVASLIAGTRYRGDFEERFKKVLKEIDPNDSIIFIDEIHMIMGAGSGEGGNIDMANMLKPMLARSGIQFIGATTLNEYKLFIEKDKALTRRFQVMMLEEPSAEESLEILKSIAPTYQNYHGFSYEEEALKASIDLTQSLLPNRKLPDKAIDILDIAFSQKKIKEYSKMLNEDVEVILRKEDIYETIHTSLETSPFFQEKDLWKRSLKFKNLQENLIKKYPQYEEVIEDLVQRMAYQCYQKEELPSKPFLSCLLVEENESKAKYLVKNLASLLWNGKENHYLSFDLEDYNDHSSLQRLIGSPLGFADHKEGGLLTESVKNTPSCVILFENVDKAYPSILSFLIKILKEGKILDSKNQLVPFSHSLIFFSLNIKNFSELLSIGFQAKDTSFNIYPSSFRENLKRKISPSLIQNIDLLHLLKSVKEESYNNKIRKEIQRLNEKLNKDEIVFSYNENFLEELILIWEKEKENFKDWQEFIYFSFKKDLTRLILDYSDSQIKSLIIKAEIVHNKVNFIIEN